LLPRKLTAEDVERMMIPPRYWRVSLQSVEATAKAHGSEEASLKEVLAAFVSKLDSQVAAGAGLLLYGNNGRGKTAALVWLAMQARRRGYTALYVETAKLKQYKIERTAFSDSESMWERALDVDVLVLDDLGKGVSDSKGFMQELVDELIRTRGAHLRTTLISTNIEPAKLVNEDFLKKSTLAMMQEMVVFLHVSGEDLRARTRVQLVEKLLGGADVA
jgi:DNA replication protein DnaC